MDALKGWRTVGFNVIVILTAIVAAVEGNPDVQSVVSQYVPWLLGAVGGINIILRAITSTGIFSKDS